MKTQAPGKIILSGEHAVVYGRPALVMAVDRLAETEVVPGETDGLQLELLDYDRSVHVDWPALAEKRQELEVRYNRFLEGSLGIREVLREPEELLLYAAALLADRVSGQLPGARVQVHSEIPRGCGMGSSAATVVAVLKGLAAYWGVPHDRELLFDLAHRAEMLQHGRSSGVDPYVSVHGGLFRFRQREGRRLSLPDAFEFKLVDTGTPESSTGEAVAWVANWVGEAPVWHDFESVALAIEEALLRRDAEGLRHWLRANQRLLEEIGVVPASVRRFVAEVEHRGGAAKVSGAGAVRGQKAGMVLTLLDEPALQELCEAFGYRWFAIQPEKEGVRQIPESGSV